MPAVFEEAIRKGAKVITKKIKGGRFIHIAYLRGKAYAGETKTKKGKA